jgi:hypothetical protein
MMDSTLKRDLQIDLLRTERDQIGVSDVGFHSHERKLLYVGLPVSLGLFWPLAGLFEGLF